MFGMIFPPRDNFNTEADKTGNLSAIVKWAALVAFLILVVAVVLWKYSGKVDESEIARENDVDTNRERRISESEIQQVIAKENQMERTPDEDLEIPLHEIEAAMKKDTPPKELEISKKKSRRLWTRKTDLTRDRR